MQEALARLRPLIDSRARRGVPRDTHGDLRLDHVYLFPERSPPGDPVIIDCIEFNERFRFADPVAGPAIQSFLNSPNDATSILRNLQAQATTIWATNG